ncbi:MAG TPA: efflux RND transporter periplasmic adaptor subunit [Planctomycetota bacterium]
MPAPGSWIAVALGLGALALAGWFLTRPDEEPSPAPRPPFLLPVTLAEVEQGELRPRAQLTATVRAARRARLAFELDGTVRELMAEEAQRVEGGAVLARLDRVDEELELAAAEAALALAQREEALLEAGERDEEKRRLAAVLESARAEEELARSEVARAEKLFESRVVSESEQDRRVSELRVAEKRRAAAEEQLARAEAGTRPEDLAIAAARVDQARVRLATTRHELAKNELRAPWSGSVLARYVSVGAYVASGDPVFELVDLEHLEIHVDVPARLATRLGASSRAHVRVPGLRQGFETALDALVPAADEAARSFRAIARLGPGDDGQALLSPGMFVDLELVLEPVPGALLVPSDCIVYSELGARVVRAVEGPPGPDGAAGLVAELVPVRVVSEEGGRSAVEALEGALVPGERVLLTGADGAFPGVALLVREPAAAAGAAR